MQQLSKPFYLAGVKFSNAHHLVTRPLSDYTPVEIRHNPENKFDPFALEVHIDGVMCGHIPRQEQAAWFYHTLRSVPILARVTAWDTNKPPHEQIQIVLECHDMYITTVTKLGDIVT